MTAGSEAHEGPQCDQLLLWAVEGLAGVVINGIPNNVPGTRALNTPRAVLWGQQDDSLVWPGTHSTPELAQLTARKASRKHGAAISGHATET